MTITPLQWKIQDLKQILLNLEAENCPAETRAKLKSAGQYLEELAQAIPFTQEQDRVAALYRVSQAMGTTLDLDEALTQVVDAVISLTSAERCFIVLLEPGSKVWQLRTARNFNQESLQAKDMEISQTVVNTVIELGEGLITTDAQNDPRFASQNSVVLFSLRSIMCSPLVIRGRVIGAIYVDHRAQIGLFTQSDLELLNAFAVQAAIAIDNARIYTRTDQALTSCVAELETLEQIDHELNTHLDIDQVLEIAHKWIVQVGAAKKAWILLTRNDNSEKDSWFVFPGEYDPAQDTLVTRAQSDLQPQVTWLQNQSLARCVIPVLHSGRTMGVFVVERPERFRDVDVQFLLLLSGRVAAAVENALLYQAVQQANQAKSKFISVVTHELRVPMTSIKGYTDLLRQGAVGPVNEMQLSFLDVIRNNVERMNALVSDLSDISRIETGRLKLDCAHISVQDSIEETLHTFQPKLQEKNQSVVLELADGLPQVYADSNRLVQILTNLVSNSWKYTPPGGSIRILARESDGFVRIEVVDNGIGISPEDQERIFTQFFRSDDPVVREEQGWGLGLSLTRRLVEIMGGSIGFESTRGEGSAFWFRLPTSENRE